MEENHIYQYSLLNALMEGVCEHGISASQLAAKGDQGLGTFARMDGELVMLEGRVWRLEASGGVREASASDEIPFAIGTRFAAQATRRVELADKGAIDGVLAGFDGGDGKRTRNLFVTYRIDGRFARLRCRTVAGQEYRGQPLSELGKKQRVHEYADVEGTVVGFKTPRNWQGFGVAGEHLHFISADRTRGGHVLDLATAGEVTVQMAVASNVHVELPTTEDFSEAELVTDDAGVREVEG